MQHRQSVLDARADLALQDLTATLRGRLSVVESQLAYAWERAGLERLLAAVQRSAVSEEEFDSLVARSAKPAEARVLTPSVSSDPREGYALGDPKRLAFESRNW